VADWVAKAPIELSQRLNSYRSLRGSSSIPVMQPRHRGLTKHLTLKDRKSFRVAHGSQALKADEEYRGKVIVPCG